MKKILKMNYKTVPIGNFLSSTLNGIMTKTYIEVVPTQACTTDADSHIPIHIYKNILIPNFIVVQFMLAFIRVFKYGVQLHET